MKGCCYLRLNNCAIVVSILEIILGIGTLIIGCYSFSLDQHYSDEKIRHTESNVAKDYLVGYYSGWYFHNSVHKLSNKYFKVFAAVGGFRILSGIVLMIGLYKVNRLLYFIIYIQFND